MLSLTLNNLISELKPRERDVVSGRFAIGRKERLTLTELGEKYGITRERVRQIEAEALRKLKEEIARERLIKFAERINKLLTERGGIKRSDIFINELKNDIGDEAIHFWHIKFLESVTNQPRHYPEDYEFHHFWYLDGEVIENIRQFINALEADLQETKQETKREMPLSERFSECFRQAARDYQIQENAGLNILEVSKKFGVGPFGEWGLVKWEEINPRTMGSKSYLVLKRIGRPLHFREVAEEINKLGFPDRRALPQTVHNELIKDPRFVLVGRGIYGLREQGYIPGTAREVIQLILKKNGPLSADQIIKEVSKERQLQKNTILLNIQNKKFFRRLADGRYALVKS